MWCATFLNVFLTLCVLKSVCSKPFLYSAPRALTSLASSASASASSPSESITNIADLRRKQQKAAALQEEKQLVEEDDDGAGFLEGDEDANNEAAPMSGSSGNGDTSNKTVNGQDNDFKKELEEFDREFENDVLNKKDEENNTEGGTFQKVIYPHSDSAVPIKVSFNINEKTVNRKQTEEITEGRDDDQFEDTSMSKLGQIGVFFAELLGSL
ncbi:hypothetical protein NQ314_000797, partial [Rhamnusium bicolor]